VSNLRLAEEVNSGILGLRMINKGEHEMGNLGWEQEPLAKRSNNEGLCSDSKSA
jgi:hypothetical protein